MNLENEFNSVIEKLRNNERPLLKFTPIQFEELNNLWTVFLETKNYTELFKVFCILDNTQNYSDIFSKNIYETFKISQDSQTLIYNLSAASKHIIAFNHKQGNRAPHDLVMVLKDLLSNRDPEVLEWTLRTIDQLGSQAIFLKDDIMKSRPGILAIFDKHKKASKQIIEMLEKRWAPRE